jgi:hypothetical protein
MALGSNLKGIKKDSLIPSKKKKSVKAKPKDVAKPKGKDKKAKKSEVEKRLKVKATSKGKTLIRKVSSKPKKETEKIAIKKPAAKPISASKPKEVPNLDEIVLLEKRDGSTISAKLIPSRRKTVRKTKLIFEGSLSLMEAEDIKNCLLRTFKDYDVIDILLSNITQIDIIPIQLIKMFIDNNPDKKIKVDSELPFDMKIIVERAGFGTLMFKEEAA